MSEQILYSSDDGANVHKPILTTSRKSSSSNTAPNIW